MHEQDQILCRKCEDGGWVYEPSADAPDRKTVPCICNPNHKDFGKRAAVDRPTVDKISEAARNKATIAHVAKANLLLERVATLESRVEILNKKCDGLYRKLKRIGEAMQKYKTPETMGKLLMEALQEKSDV